MLENFIKFQNYKIKKKKNFKVQNFQKILDFKFSKNLKMIKKIKISKNKKSKFS